MDWKSKHQSREKFINRYISSFDDNNSGKRGVDVREIVVIPDSENQIIKKVQNTSNWQIN